MKQKRNYSASSAGGFTLIEVMVALGVLAILTSYAVPAFNNLISNTRIENRANEMYGALKQTRHNAITKNNFSFMCRSNNAVTNVNAAGAACRIAGLGVGNWNSELMIYHALPDTNVPTPNASFGNLRIQRLEANGAKRKQMLQSVREAPAGNLTIVSGVNNHVIAFDRTGALVNTAPFRFAICDNRGEPETYGRIIEINQSGQLRLYKTDVNNTNRDCTPTNL